MKKMALLTSISPDGVEGPCYVDPQHVILITREKITLPDRKTHEEKLSAIWSIYSEVQLAQEAILKLPNINPESEAQEAAAKRWLERREIAASLSAAYGNISEIIKRYPPTLPEFDCTVVHLSCGTALEQGVMLTRVWVKELPNEVVNILYG